MNIYDSIKNFYSDNKKWFVIAFTVFGLVVLSGVVYAFIQENGKVKGTTFKVSSTPVQQGEEPSEVNENLKLLKNLAGNTDSSNLSDEVNGPVFENITTAWKDRVLLKVYNKGTVSLKLVSKADYADDPNTLRDDLFVKISAWDDIDNDGVLDDGEAGQVYGYDTILRMKNDTFNLGNINGNSVKGLVMEFDGSGLSEANANQIAIYDFIISGEEIL